MNLFFKDRTIHTTTGIRVVLVAGPDTNGRHLRIVSGTERLQAFGPQGSSHNLAGDTAAATAGNPTVRDDYNYMSIATGQSQTDSYNDLIAAIPEYLKGYYLGSTEATANHMGFTTDPSNHSFDLWRQDGVSMVSPTITEDGTWDVTASTFTTVVVEDHYAVAGGLSFSYFPASGLINNRKLNGVVIPAEKGTLIELEGFGINQNYQPIKPYFTRALS